MYLKIIGGIVIIFSSGLIGIAVASKYAFRPLELRKTRILFQMLETEVIYGATPLPVAFKNISNKSDEVWNKFFLEVNQKLVSGSYYSLTDAWNKSLDEIIIETHLDKMDVELLKNFGTILGCSDRADQQKHFKLLYAQMHQHEEIAEQERKKNEKMYRSLGFLFGIFIFIILI